MTRETRRFSATRLVHAGRGADAEGGRPVNPSVVRLSTVLFDSVAQMRDLHRRRDSERLLTYGARGNPTAYALEDLVTELEGGYRTHLFPTGLAAIAQVFLAYLRPGDHVIIADSVYEPVRQLCHAVLDRYGILYDFLAGDGSGLDELIRPETRLLYLECPGSFAYELCDLPALAARARAHGILVAADNTWGAGGLYRPLGLGADVSIVAATKYLSGHSDVVMGAVTTNETAWPALHAFSDATGTAVSPDDAYLVLRGARSLAARLPMHRAGALAVAEWLSGHPRVAEVLCPALPQHPGHALWKRDFHGTNGLLSFRLRDGGDAAAVRVVDGLRLFGLGASWGGFESLVTLADLGRLRTVACWPEPRLLIRLHIGLESPADLIADLDQALGA